MKKWLFFLLMSVPAWCGVLPENTKLEVFEDFSGGLNTSVPASKLPKSQSPSMCNVIIDDGDIHKVGGYHTVGSTPTLSKVNFFYAYIQDDGTKEYIVSDSSIVLATKDFNVYTLLRSGLNANFKLNAFTAREKCWIQNGIDAPFTYDGSTVVVLDGGFYGGVRVANPPRCRYGVYYQDRVWLYNSNTNASILRWCALTSTDTIPSAIAPDSENAWKDEALALQIGRGDGQVGTGLRVYNGLLQASKQRSMYSIFGDDDSNYREVRTIGDYGFTDNDSVVELDGYLYGKGQDGYYQYNGRQMQRITDDIQPDMDAVQTSANQILSETWNTFEKFGTGEFTFNSTNSLYGVTLLSSSTLLQETHHLTVTTNTLNTITSIQYGDGMPASNPDFSETTTIFDRDISTNIANFGQILEFASVRMKMAHGLRGSQGGNGSVVLITSVTNVRTHESATDTITSDSFLHCDLGSSCGADTPYTIFTATSTNLKLNFSATDLNDGNIKLKLIFKVSGYRTEPPNSIAYISIYSNDGRTPEIEFVVKNPSASIATPSTGSYISAISTFSSSMNSWSYFNTNSNNSGGTLNFYYKTATSPVNITTYPWNPILSGSLISAKNTDNYIQWASTMISASTTTQPTISEVQINAILGGSSDSNPIASEWKGRYWTFVSTVSGGATSKGYIKSLVSNKNPNAWMSLEGINLKSILRDGQYLYGGASTCSLIYRLDTGLNFNGSPINAWYETPDVTMGQPFFDKTLLEYSVDVEKESGANLTIGTSVDGRAFNNYSFSIDGTGRLVKNYPISLGMPKGNMFRWRFSNSESGKDLGLLNFGVFYVPTPIRTNR